ncbi:5'-nucleotidase C-terminal domain-containing protein [Christiangramia salexigens]|uniref:5'-Nucleotidase C-terminal domain-containing protein n=1 Tax=Christiangramia salexigens TaxID=1913577 RepID=A0A1L3J1J0_9FLAO|nr:5'-nucleotidase [Christiangramia salexigens]APG58981.1 hypothetical protein LPB144_00545 [Christiangramia salexigens]
MKFYKLLVLSIGMIFFSCKNETHSVTETTGTRLSIDNKIKANNEFEDFIEPYKEHLNATLDSVLAYNPRLLSKSDGDLNTALGNLMADAVFEQAGPVFKSRTGKNLDFVLLNHGGIRAQLPKGNISSRHAYALMPFENEIVIAELSGKKVKEMLKYLSKAKTAHPVSGIRILANKNFKIINATINGQPIQDDETYFVATSDYLQQGGDNMRFFKDPVNLYSVDYKLRNAIIDYFKKTDTIKNKKDERYIRS